MTEAERRTSVIGELGLVLEADADADGDGDGDGDGLHGTVPVVPAMFVPGTSSLRASVVVAWADTLLGLLAVRLLAPRVPVTLELDVHLIDDLRGADELTLTGRVLKAGKSVLVSRLDLAAADGRRVGLGHALFMANPDPRVTMRTGNWALNRFRTRGAALDEPFADRLGCFRTGRGEAVLPCSPDVLNQSKSLNGGLLGVVVEEAALSADPAERPLSSMHLRYLRGVRQGPAEARAEVRGDLGEVEVRDAATGALAVVATTRAAAHPSVSRA